VRVLSYTTSGVITSTSRRAADLDFHVTVVSDACADKYVLASTSSPSVQCVWDDGFVPVS
jgi:hypothetical protein